VHRTEDEIFHVLSGELRCVIGDKTISLSAGETAQAPMGMPHTYVVVSSEGARWLTVTCRGDFERLVRSLSRPAEGDALLSPPVPPSAEQAAALAAACLAHGIELIGPPLAILEGA
jgi:hypothetical protein